MASRVKWFEHPEYDEFLKEVVPGRPNKEVIELFYEKFGVRITDAMLANRKVTLHLKNGVNGGRFKKGFTPWNKNMPYEEMKKYYGEEQLENIQKNLFKKGYKPKNTQYIGYERLSKEGVIQVKVNEQIKKNANKNFISKAAYIWQRSHHKEVPENHVVIFKDRDVFNFHPDNLLLVSRSELLLMNNLAHRGGEYNAENIDQVKTWADLKLKVSELQKSERKCKVCGNMFKPRFKNQRTCDKCLGKM